MGPATVASPFQGAKAQAPSPSFTEETYAVFLSYSISPKDLWNAIAARDAPQLVDVRRREPLQPQVTAFVAWRSLARCCEDQRMESRIRRDPTHRNHLQSRPRNEPKARSAQLRADGIGASVLEGGYEGWANAGLPLVAKSELDRLTPKRPSVWVTRRRPKIDRIACPWLICRFLDPQARILFVEALGRGGQRRA